MSQRRYVNLLHLEHRGHDADHGRRGQPACHGPNALTANLKPLARRGWVEMQVDENDKRARRLVLTRRGLRVLAKAVPVWRAVHGDIDASLSTDEEALRRTLRELASAPGGADAAA